MISKWFQKDPAGARACRCGRGVAGVQWRGRRGATGAALRARRCGRGAASAARRAKRGGRGARSAFGVVWRALCEDFWKMVRFQKFSLRAPRVGLGRRIIFRNRGFTPGGSGPFPVQEGSEKKKNTKTMKLQSRR